MPEHPYESRRYSIAGISDEPYRRVGGLMLLLCFSLVVVNPLIEGSRFLVLWSRAAPAIADGRVKVALAGYAVVVLGMALFGLLAGLLLWRVHRAGRGLCIGYFVMELGLVLLVAAVAVLYGAQRNAGAEAFAAMIPFLLPSVARSAVWLLYLKTSRRVKRTYQLRHANPVAGAP